MTEVSILIVDDDDDVRLALHDELSPRYAVSVAAGAVEAFAALSARRFDVIISDLRMPDHDGIELLDFARDQQPGIIRILLTGYTDERAHAALLAPDAPFKVGKPWYDELEVVLARALEQRGRTDLLEASLESAFGLQTLDGALDAAKDLAELGELIALRAAMVTGVAWCGCTLDGTVVAGQVAAAADDGERPGGWRLDLPIDGAARLHAVAGGHGNEARALIVHLTDLVRRKAGVLTAITTALPADDDRPRRSRLDELMRQATVGAMAGMLIHGVAGIVQSLAFSGDQLAAFEAADPQVAALAADVAAASREGVGLFAEMRKFMSDGRPSLRPIAADDLIRRALHQVGGELRARATLRVTPTAGAVVEAAGALTVHVLVAVLRNAAAASPAGGIVDVAVGLDGDRVRFTVTDDGPGVEPALAGLIFEAELWKRSSRIGTGLAIAAHAIQAQGGTIDYHRAPGRGACFAVTLPRAR